LAFEWGDLQKNAAETIGKLGGAKAVMAAAGLLFVAFLLSYIVYNNTGDRDFAVLYTHLNPDDAGSVLSVLQENKIPYEVEGDGSIILAPRSDVYAIRLKLAAQGIPRAKAVGLELFETPKMGTTQFQENVNYLRGIEGEMVRTIRQIDAVQDAKVNIALPKESIFVREDEAPKASVIIRLWPGRDLSREQVKAIVFLLSHAVAKLDPSNVTVVDNRGRVLSDVLEEPDQAQSGDALADAKKRLERRLEKNVQSMLAKALGAEKVVVRASVDLETGSLHQQDELYDPDKTAVLSERKIQESGQNTNRTPAGVPGTASNVPATTASTGTTSANSTNSKKDVTTNYDVSKSVIDTKKPIYAIKKLSIGVLIDGKYTEQQDANGTKTRTFVPRTDAELDSYRELIKSAVGFDERRGDKISVVSVPFEAKTETVEAKPQQMSQKEMLIYALFGLAGLILLVILLWLMKRMFKKAPETPPAAVEGIGTPAEMAEELKAAHEKEAKVMTLEDNDNYNDLIEIIDENPQIIASLLGKWIKDEAPAAS
jgi:flagellar M-ring protein FliF